MNPFPERLAAIHSHLASHYGQRDTQATEILLAALLPASLTRMRRPWLILETDYLNRDTSDAWFSLGVPETVQARSLAIPRVMRREPGHEYVEEILRERTRDVPGVFTDAEWRRVHYSGRGWTAEARANYYVLMATCVRLRVEHPKSDYAIRDTAAREAGRRELARLARRVMDTELRAREPVDSRDHTVAHRTLNAFDFAVVNTPGGNTPVRDIPKSFFYWCELLQRMAPVQQDWESLTGALVAIARGVSYLYGDGRPPDWEAAERVYRDTIPYATGWLMGEAEKSPVVAKNAYYKSGGEMLTRERVVLELQRLHREGVLLKRQGHKGLRGSKEPWKYRLAHADWHTVLDRDVRIFV